MKENIKVSSLKEVQIAKNIVNEIRKFGVNDNIILVIFEQLALDLEDISLMRELREFLKGRTVSSQLREIGETELENLSG
jgi:hypothetical protein